MDSVKLDNEAARVQFKRLCESWKLKETDDNKEHIKLLVEAVEEGRFVVIEGKDEGYKLIVKHNLLEPISEDGKKDHLLYKFLFAGDMMSLDKYGEDDVNSRMAGICQVFSKENINFIKRMHPRDMFLGGTLGGLFLGV